MAKGKEEKKKEDPRSQSTSLKNPGLAIRDWSQVVVVVCVVNAGFLLCPPGACSTSNAMHTCAIA